MKKKILICNLFLFSCLSLASCQILRPSTSDTGSDDSNTTINSDTIVVPQSSSDTSVQKASSIQIIGVTDLHGACVDQPYTYGHYSMGLAKMSTYFANLSENKTTFTLSVGDMWQGSIESNYNYGAYVTEAMNIMNFDAMAVGNHEFDWGIEKIEDNSKIADFPFLAANVRTKDTNELIKGVHASTLIEKDGVKLGVIGTIGQDQYRDISYNRVKDLVFTEKKDIVLAEAKSLKESGADMIVLLSHEDFSSKNLNDDRRAILDSGMIDLVLDGHTHTRNVDSYKNIPILRAASNGIAYDIVNIDLSKDVPSIKSADVKYFSENDFKNTSYDSKVVELCEKKYDVEEYRNTVIATSTDSISKSNFAKVVAESIYDKITTTLQFQYFDLYGAFTNVTRKDVPKGPITIGLMWEVLPFDNEILLMTLKGSTIKRCDTNDNSVLNLGTEPGIYPFDIRGQFKDDEYYNIAVIDYLGYKIKDEYIIDEVVHTNFYMRDLTIDFLMKTETLNANRYL